MNTQRLPIRHSGRTVPLALLTLFLSRPAEAHASLFQGDTLDSLANGIAWVVLVIAPIIGITVFWLVHILPEKIAEKKKHPQAKAIQCLCLLSLCFAGLLWPLAWLWAYTKPVGYKLAYGTDKHPDYFKEHGLPEPDDAAVDIRQRVDALEGHGVPAGELEAIRSDLATLESKLAASSSGSEVA